MFSKNNGIDDIPSVELVLGYLILFIILAFVKAVDMKRKVCELWQAWE